MLWRSSTFGYKDLRLPVVRELHRSWSGDSRPGLVPTSFSHHECRLQTLLMNITYIYIQNTAYEPLPSPEWLDPPCITPCGSLPSISRCVLGSATATWHDPLAERRVGLGPLVVQGADEHLVSFSRSRGRRSAMLGERLQKLWKRQAVTRC